MKKALVILAAVLVVVSMFTGCKKEPEIKSYTVTFDVNGGTGKIESQTVVENEKATKPAANPTYAGAVFQGWSATKDGTTAFDFNTPITADITLYAMWNKSYKVGGTGPAGGYIFYDVDADNDVEYKAEDGTTKTNKDGVTSAELGWKYIEVAPEDLSGTYIFGFYRPTDDGTNEVVTTGTAVGTGKANTEALVKAMGETTYKDSTGTDKGTYAAKACADYTYGGYDDWFLPSRDELNAMNLNLRYEGKGGTWQKAYYWSSTEYTNTNAYQVMFDDTFRNNTSGRDASGYVRAIRAF